MSTGPHGQITETSFPSGPILIKDEKEPPPSPQLQTPKTIGQHDVKAQTARREEHYHGSIVYHSMASRCIPRRGHEHPFPTKTQLLSCICLTYLITSGRFP
ncbi:hypothetical protein QR685DRAFT_571598 [Neurospora intermedia]|uniref:Uncharacterized protein n=1 Tax=Neurospora intermedia TaxID=5142 RepID=A0ABR3DCT9_NEUIN